MFENGGRTTTDGWTPEHGYTISSPCEPNGSGELKTNFAKFDIVVKKFKVNSGSSFI